LILILVSAPPIHPIFITLDPSRDSIEQLKHYKNGFIFINLSHFFACHMFFCLSLLLDFHPSFQYLTGTNEMVRDIAHKFRVYFTTTTDDENIKGEVGSFNFMTDGWFMVVCWLIEWMVGEGRLFGWSFYRLLLNGPRQCPHRLLPQIPQRSHVTRDW